MRFFRKTLIAAMTGLAAAGCGVSAEPEGASTPGQPTEQPFHQHIMKVAADYETWGRVDGKGHWAPVDCRSPPPPSQVFVSQSDDDKTHGQKIYSLFARNRDEYYSVDKSTTAAVGQVIVKQSWVPEEVTDSNEMD